MHRNPGFCSVLGTPCTKILDFAACTRIPVLVFGMLNMDSLEVAASVGSDAQDLVHDSRGPLSPLLFLASVYMFRPRFVIQALFLKFWN